MKKIYIASKITHARRWLKLWETHPDLHITSRWPALVVAKVAEDSRLASRFWEDDLRDVEDADFLICYGEPEENLRGALVEAGAALAFGKSVLCVGENANFATWQYHPLVTRVFTLDLAFAWIRTQ